MSRGSVHVHYVCLHVNPGTLCVRMSMWVGVCACVCMQILEADMSPILNRSA